jgi:tetratricopeptide (TPR) repeat protein
MLSGVERAALAALSVFHGGCTREAAEVVAGADVRMLSHLLRKSLIQREPGDRYTMHPLLGEYAARQLEQDPEQRERAHDRHCAYYVAFNAAHEPEAFWVRHAAMVPEAENLWAAWRWAIERRRAADIRRLLGCHLEGFYRVYRLVGRRPDEDTLFLQAIDVLRTCERSDQNRLALGIALRALAWQRHWDHRSGEGIDLAKESCALFADLGAREEWTVSVAVLYMLGGCGRGAEAERLLREALDVCQEIGFRGQEGWLLQLLGDIARWRGDYEEATRRFRDAIPLLAEAGGRSGVAWAWCVLGSVAVLRGNYAEARQCHLRSCSLFADLGWQTEVADLLNHLGSDALALGEYKEAAQRYCEALDIAHNVGHGVHEVRSLVNLGRLALARRETREARTRYRQALALAVERADPALAVGALDGPVTWYMQETSDAGGKVRAAELLALAMRGPRANAFYRFEQLALRSLQAELPSDVFDAACERGAARDLWETVHALLGELKDVTQAGEVIDGEGERWD